MLVSVIMSVYNSENYIFQAIDSILQQSYKNFEFIIIDDASTDSSVNIIESFNDSRIKLIRNNCNKGITKNLNTAIRMANGKYIARMDADDICDRERLFKQVKVLESKKNIGICGTWGYKFYDSGRRIKLRLPITDEKIKKRLICYNFMIHPSIMMRKEVANRLYDENFKSAQDYKFWADNFDTDFYNIPEYLIFYRNNKKGMSVMQRKNIQERIALLSPIYNKMLENLGYSLNEHDLYLYVKTMQNLNHFEDRNESEKSIKLLQNMFVCLNNIDKKTMLCHWAKANEKLPKFKYLHFYFIGKLYNYINILKMIM